MTYLLAELTLVASKLATAIICLLIQRFVPVPVRERHHEVGTTIFL